MGGRCRKHERRLERYFRSTGPFLLLANVASAALLGEIFFNKFCTHCENAKSWDDCYEDHCKHASEDCYVHVSENRNGKRINAGCMDRDDDRCKRYAPDHDKGRDWSNLIGKRAKTLCETCCEKDNCNVEFCKHIDFTTHQSGHGKIDHCRKCTLDRFTWECDKFESCGNGEVCFIQELKAVTLTHRTYYHGGCTDIKNCDTVHVKSFENEHRLGEVTNGACCYETACNNKTIFHPTNSPPKTTPKPAATEDAFTWEGDGSNTIAIRREQFFRPAPVGNNVTLYLALVTTSSHIMDLQAASSTRLVTSCKPTRSNSSSCVLPYTLEKTPTITTTKAPSSAICELCNGGNCGFIPVNNLIVQCTHEQPYCMNIVTNTKNGLKSVTKRCAAKSECEQKWYNETTGKPECLSFHANAMYNFDFACHYCCVTDRCNKDVFPEANTLYTGTH